MGQAAAAISTVIVRLDRTTQYSASVLFNLNVGDYWVPRFRGGMTAEEWTRAY
jgi:hypothetical protein